MPILQGLIVPGALLILAGSFIVAWLTGVRRNYLLLLSLSYIALAIGFCFLLLRWHPDDYLALAVGNALFILAQVLFGEALLQRRNKTMGIAGNLIAFSAISGIYLYYLTFGTVFSRTIAINVCLFIFMVLIVARFWIHKSDTIHEKLIFWTLVALGVMHTMRSIGTLFTVDIANPASAIWQFLQIYILLIAMIVALEVLASHFVETLDNLNRLRDQDNLSGVLNRAGFDRAVDTVYRTHSGYAIALILLDLDDFKIINDSFGHPVGDAVLTAFGRLLVEQSRGSDVVGRIGGDEFAILTTRISQEGAAEMAERIRRQFSGIVFEGMPPGVRVGCSAGVARLSARSGYEALYHDADKALYKAKRSGRNQVVSGIECAGLVSEGDAIQSAIANGGTPERSSA